MNGHIRQKSLMVVLAIVLLIAALHYGWSLLGFGGLPVADRYLTPRREEPPARAPGDQLAVLRLADLERVPESPAIGRNPWGFVDPPPTPSISRRLAPIPEPPPAAPIAAAREGSPRPEFTLRYLGRFGPAEKKIAVFTDGTRVLNRLEGDMIDGRFKVERIGYESVEIGFVNFPEAPSQRVGVTPR